MKPSSVKDALNFAVAIQHPCFIWGAPGVGKSDVVAQVAAERKLEMIDVRLGLLDPVDLKGFPVPNLTKKEMNWLPADFLPKNAKSKGILFLDEMNQAPPAVQAAAYQLVLNRRIGDYKLPDGWAIIAAGNRESDRSVTNRMPAALANRMTHIDFAPDLEDWCTWAVKNGVGSNVIAFLRFRSNLLHSFDPATNPKAFPSPRSWVFVDKIDQSGLSADTEFELIKGTVGEGAAGEFLAFVKVAKNLPTIDEILLNPEKTKVPDSPATLFALSTMLGMKAAKDNFDRLMGYITRMPVEFQVVTVRDAIKRESGVSNTKSFSAWAVANQAVLT